MLNALSGGIEYADVAELADALASGASECKFMWVRLPSSAPRRRKLCIACGDFLLFVMKIAGALTPLLLLSAKGPARRACSLVNALTTALCRYQPFAVFAVGFQGFLLRYRRAARGLKKRF